MTSFYQLARLPCHVLLQTFCTISHSTVMFLLYHILYCVTTVCLCDRLIWRITKAFWAGCSRTGRRATQRRITPPRLTRWSFTCLHAFHPTVRRPITERWAGSCHGCQDILWYICHDKNHSKLFWIKPDTQQNQIVTIMYSRKGQ